jgi:hypothetical protein
MLHWFARKSVTQARIGVIKGTIDVTDRLETLRRPGFVGSYLTNTLHFPEQFCGPHSNG